VVCHYLQMPYRLDQRGHLLAVFVAWYPVSVAGEAGISIFLAMEVVGVPRKWSF